MLGYLQLPQKHIFEQRPDEQPTGIPFATEVAQRGQLFLF